jgi:hypothetical protein
MASMNPVVAYAKVVKSFQNLYLDRDPSRNTVVAIACAMSGIFLVNVWTIVLLVSLFDHGWLGNRREISGIEFSLLALCLFAAEYILVYRVLNRVKTDKAFASIVAPAAPNVAKTYAATSVLLLLLLTAAKLIFV